MTIGILRGFPPDFTLVADLLKFYSQQPGASIVEIERGVGLNTRKINALNHFMKFLGLQKNRTLTNLGHLILQHDRHLKDIGTLSLFHYWLGSCEEIEVWYFAMNHFITKYQPFNRDELIQALNRANIGQHSLKHLKQDISLLVNTYTSTRYQALQPLTYIKLTTKNQYEANSINSIPPLILAFILYYRREQSIQTSTISINHLLTLPGQVGKLFLLSREQLLTKLKEIEAKGLIGIDQIANLDNITFLQLEDPFTILTQYYRERDEY